MPATADGGSPSPRALPAGPVFDDACQSVPGYRDFRIELEKVVQSRDAAALRQLFHPSGSMRISGIGGDATTEDWGFSKPYAHEVWTELEEILKLGCAPQGQGLVLPAMAAMIENPEISTDHVVALEAVDLKSAPTEASATVRRLAPGELVYFVYLGDPGGWSKLFVDDEEVFAPADSFRSPFASLLLLERYEGKWRIREFRSGI